jgi:hypothetical protein
MASTVSVTSTITGTLNGQTHTITGTASRQISAFNIETFDVDTSYKDVNESNVLINVRTLIVNEGDNEIKVRIEREVVAKWEYIHIPAGRFAEVFSTDAERISSTILTISIKAVTGTSRVVVLQAAI